MVQAALEDSLSNLAGTERFQNSKTKQTSTEDKRIKMLTEMVQELKFIPPDQLSISSISQT
jgi:hypothetical protein